MASKSLLVFAKISPKPEYLTDARSAVLGIVQRTRAEPGCRQFFLNEGIDDECLYLYEEWESEAALAQHYDQRYTAEVFDAYQRWLAKPVDVVKMESVD